SNRFQQARTLYIQPEQRSEGVPAGRRHQLPIRRPASEAGHREVRSLPICQPASERAGQIRGCGNGGSRQGNEQADFLSRRYVGLYTNGSARLANEGRWKSNRGLEVELCPVLLSRQGSKAFCRGIGRHRDPNNRLSFSVFSEPASLKRAGVCQRPFPSSEKKSTLEILPLS